MGKFWQNLQFSVQPERKMVPEPRVPEMGGSSPRWMAAEAMRAVLSLPQRPLSPASRFTPQACGQMSQAARRAYAALMRRASSPLR
jgi:hypothetical protein